MIFSCFLFSVVWPCGNGPFETNPLGGWHANLYLIDMRNCIRFCHDQVRCMLFVSGLKKADFANLDFWFQNLFANTVLKLRYEPELIEAAMDLADELQFDTVCNRSVIAKKLKCSECHCPANAMKDFLQEITGISCSWFC